MVRKISLIIFLSIGFASCIMEQENVLIAPSCTDGILNQDEEKIDCGGRCNACEVETIVEVPCAGELINNKFDLFYYDLIFNETDYELYDYSEMSQLFIYKDYVEVKINIYGGIPDEDHEYTVVHPTQLGEGNASMQVIDSNTAFRSTSGKIYVLYKNSLPTIQFCDVTMVSQEADYSASGKVTIY